MTEDEQVRRLLADAQHTEPIPPDVARRIDGVIADLRADRAPRAGVSDLAAARRRRRARTLLVAAAVVVAAGVGINQLRGVQVGDSGGDNSSADSAAGSTLQREAGDAPEAAPSPQDGVRNGAQAYASRRPVRLDPERFADQVARLRVVARRDVTPAAAGGVVTGDADQGLGVFGAEASACLAPVRGRVVLVRYAGAPGVLVFRPRHGDTQVVDLYLCGRSGTYRSITLPAP